LWRESLRHAFPNSSGRRKQISSAMERVRKFRNRLAHHDSMINVDVPFEIRQVIELASFISADAARWLERQSQAMSVYAQRPIALDDTVVVPAKNAWPLYEECRAYVCQPGRAFRKVERIAFYADREIHRQRPQNLPHRGNGRGSAFTQRQRYISLHTLETATSTEDL